MTTPSGTANLPIPALAHKAYARLVRQFDSTYGGFGHAPKFPQVSTTTGFLARFAVASAAKPSANSADPPPQPSAEEVLSVLDGEPPEDASPGEGDAERALEMATFTMSRIYAGGVHDHVGGGVARYSVDERWHVPHFEKMLFVLLSSSISQSSLM